MGWKALKDKYAISHIVQVRDGWICIGSGYVHDIVKINMATGGIEGNRTFPDFLRRDYPTLADADAEDILALINAPDEFTASIPVYTYRGAEIIEKQCEVIDWPNVTHDGELMYENTFSTDRAEVIRWAKRTAASAVEWRTGSIADAQQKLAELRAELVICEASRSNLDADFPDIEAAP